MRLANIHDLARKGIVFLVLVSMNCKDPIVLKGEGSIGLLVVDGNISTLPGPYTLKLGLTVGLDQKPNPVSLAHALLVDDDNGATEEYVETKPGVYSVPGTTIQGTIGHRYHVEVALPDGRSYATKPELIPDATGVDSLYFEVGTTSDFVDATEVKVSVVNVYTNTQLPQSEKDYYLRWNATETYMFEQTPIPNPLTGTLPLPCYVDGIPDGQRITLFSTEGQHRQQLDKLLVAARKIDQSFLARHYFTVYQSSLTLEAYNYWKNVNQLINRNGSIFDTPPAPILGNAFSKTDDEEKVLGFFEATNTTLSRFYLLKGDIPLAIQPYCMDPRYGIYWPGYPRECRDCLSLDNSSNTPPDWWQN
jgi:hypothetical protein